ncbi:diadenylate cyclase [Thermoactinomyces sp. DSM 45891]|nr:diadenylate cyclase [Thermoactinomyces sp. DSM 45891]
MQSLVGITKYINDFIDILIVSFLIYQLLTLLRGTRAVQLLKGISVVVFLWLLSNFLELRTLRWLIENLLSVGLITVIIIFQPELRRALEQIGRRGFFTRGQVAKDEVVTRVSGEITKAVTYFASKRIGSLIVIERETGLSDYIESGIELQAKVSNELLRNIFLPSSPLHDGAAVIRVGSIMAAGCFLPLSENPSISKELGTRHRAAIGMSEVSDACVVIVSEETGQISIAIGGKLERGISEDLIFERLYQQIQPNSPTISIFRSWRERRGKK